MDGLIEFDITAPEDKPQVYEFEVFLEMPTSLDFCVVATDVVDRRQGAAFRGALGSRDYIFTHSSETHLLTPTAPQMFDGKGNGVFSTVILDWVEWEGPLVSDAEKSRRKDVVPPNDVTPELVLEYLQRFAERAWRRPAKKEELEQYLRSYRTEREAGEKMADAYRVALQGVLTSRHFIELVDGSSSHNWDQHGDMAEHAIHAKNIDQPVAGLLKDLKRRGMLEETLVVWTTEFGRTPGVDGNKGRGHHSACFCSWLAGGGVKGGMTWGATDEIASTVAANKVHVHDFHATILHLMGMNHEKLTCHHGGRDYRLTDVAGNVVRELIA